MKAKGKSLAQKERQRNSEFPDRRWTRKLDSWGSTNTGLSLSGSKPLRSTSLPSIPGNPALPEFRHPIDASSRLFSVACKWPLDCFLTCVSGRMAAMQSIATTTDDLENRE